MKKYAFSNFGHFIVKYIEKNDIYSVFWLIDDTENFGDQEFKWELKEFNQTFFITKGLNYILNKIYDT